ncbi:RNA polymerase sigma-70 factor [Actinoplanes sp. NPDC049265]|uniref:RNA polymerase sigma-70 factor n=1 Tax=Actinoplanes sp. NPDC049265 TaxID=3363902 RepID=UPI0037116A28
MGVELDEAAAAFQEVRPRLFGIAYRMLGSVGEADDLVQDVWLRWQGTDRDEVRNPGAFLATVTTRLAVNELRSARVRRETYVGPWLPEPVDTAADPFLGAERGEALELAVLTLMEKLTPPERAAYVLREAFDYPYAEIAVILRSTEPAVRQLVSRARKHVAGERKAEVPAEAQRRLLATFLDAARDGELAALEKLFAADVASVSDGNGARNVSRLVVTGAERVARFVTAFSSWYWTGVTFGQVTANGRPGVLLRRGDQLLGLVTLTATADGVDRLLWQMNPAKLRSYAG